MIDEAAARRARNSVLRYRNNREPIPREDQDIIIRLCESRFRGASYHVAPEHRQQEK